ncbi:MAG: TRAP transporter TatT component family protein, partial [Acidiferrobacterales bacterium]|nr:TRAP transporter TatT component family protein [Acidiferrobacterales bacterium]
KPKTEQPKTVHGEAIYRQATQLSKHLSAGVASLLVLCLLFVTAGCSVRKFAAERVANVLAEGGSVYASDDDPDLVGEALPFGLKTMEGLLVEIPDHRSLLIATASGFTQYAYAYVDLPAFETEDEDWRRARELRLRAKRLYLRSRDYAFRALALREPDFGKKLREDPKTALIPLKTEDVAPLYWATVSWSAAIAADKRDMDLIADLNLIGPMINRCLELNESFDQGAIHQFLISYEGSRSSAQGGSVERAREHFERAMVLARGQQVSPLVAFAETVSVRLQDRKQFTQLLEEALAFDVNEAPEHRLANLIAQRRAQVLLARIDDYFIGN